MLYKKWNQQVVKIFIMVNSGEFKANCKLIVDELAKTEVSDEKNKVVLYRHFIKFSPFA